METVTSDYNQLYIDFTYSIIFDYRFPEMANCTTLLLGCTAEKGLHFIYLIEMKNFTLLLSIIKIKISISIYAASLLH